MKKITLMAATVISAATLAGTSMTANAACAQNVNINSGKAKIIRIGQGCDLNSLLSQLKNCFPGIQIPQPEQPDFETPAPELPDAEIPAPEMPDSEIPAPELPEIELPTPEMPDNETPTPELPDVEVPAPEIPSPELPDVETPSPEFPTPETPSPELPEQENPSPELPEENLTYVEQVINLVNEERAKEGLSPLTLDTKVAAAAQVRAEEIVTSFSHTRPDGTSFATALKEQNVNYRRAGENIAWGQKSPEEVVNAWMNSSGHRANIMNSNFTSIGVGYYQHNGVNYWCQLFTA